MRWITDNLKRAAWLIGAALAVTVLTAIGADVVQLGLDVIGPHATTKNARAIVFTGSGVSTNTSAGGTNTVTITGGSGITTAVSTNLAAGLPTVVGSELRVGTNSTSGAYQMFTSQVSTNGSYTMRPTDIGKLFAYTVTTSPTFTLTNANLFAAGQAIGLTVEAGTTNTLSNKLLINPAAGDTINSVTNLQFAVTHDSVILVSDGVSKWVPISLIGASGCNYYDTTSVSVNETTTHYVVFDQVHANNYDSGNYHSTSTNPTRFNIQQSGYYLIRGATTQSTTVGHTDDYTIIEFEKNRDGVTYLLETKTYRPTTANTVREVIGVVYLQAGDYIEFLIYHYRQSDSSAVSYVNNTVNITKIQ